MKAIVSALALTLLLAGCARTPPMYSLDGAGLADLDRKEFRYLVPGKAETKCRGSEQAKAVVCDDGTTSGMVAAGLPFVGVSHIDFDGRRFFAPDFYKRQRENQSRTAGD